MSTNKKAVRFEANVSPGESLALTREIDEPATVEQCIVRFYRGPELAVQVRPLRIPDNGNGRPQPLVDIVGSESIIGDGDKWIFDVSEPVEKGDVLEMQVENTATDDPQLDLTYTVVIDLSLDREGGVLRPFRNAVDNLSGRLFA